MVGYLIRRSLLSVTMLWGAATLIFLLMRALPGDPAATIGGPHTNAEVRATIRREQLLDRPMYVQYGHFMHKLVIEGDFGKSYRLNKSVNEKLISYFPRTVILAVAAMSVAVIFGIGAGVISAVFVGGWLDNFLRAFSIFFISMPSFVLAIWVSIIFGFYLEWLPISGFSGQAEGWKYLILPGVALGTRPMAEILRLTRTSLLEVINMDYIRTARAKGVKEAVVVVVHGLRNSLIPVVTSIGSTMAALLGGALFIEIIFNWPGLGKLIYEGIDNKDYAIVQGGALLTGAVFICINLFMDVVYAILDPRISYS